MSPLPGPATASSAVLASLSAVVFVAFTRPSASPAAPQPASPAECVCGPCLCGPCDGGYTALQLYTFGALCLLAGVGIFAASSSAVRGLQGLGTAFLATCGLSVVGHSLSTASAAAVLDRDIVLKDGDSERERRSLGGRTGSPGSSVDSEAW